MVAYNFQRQFVDKIRDGSKRQTIRANGMRRHAWPGERLQLYTGMRTKGCEKILAADPVCVESCEVTLARGKFGLMITAPAGVVPHSVNDFARADGFDSAEDMFDWFDRVHGLPFTGTLIRWEPR